MYTSIGNLPDSMHKALQSSGVELHFRNLDACVVVFFFSFFYRMKVMLSTFLASKKGINSKITIYHIIMMISFCHQRFSL